MAVTPVATVDATGFHIAQYTDLLSYLQAAYRAIYGLDVYLGADAQDGQLLALLALALSDANAMAAAVYNAFSPATAQGTGLSSVVKINGIARLIPTFSTANVVAVGQTGTVITGGIVADSNGNKWDLPATVTIPLSGQITVTATCETAGSVVAAANTITIISSPTAGWQTVTNPNPAVIGAPLEIDAALRNRQTLSTELPSTTILAGIVGAVAAISGVIRVQSYENDTNVLDANSQPPHTIALVVDGGDATTIANTIFVKKTPGAGTFGSTTIVVADPYGVPHNVSFSLPTIVSVSFVITVKALVGFTSIINTAMVQAVSDWVNALAIGKSIYLSRVYMPANLYGVAANGAATYEVVSITTSRSGNPFTAADITIAYNEAAACTISLISVIVT